MSDGSRGISPRTWNALAVGVLLLAIAIGIILYSVTDEILNTLAAILLVYGVYVAAMSFARKGGEDNFGPSAADAAMAGGAILAGVGLAMFAYSLTEGDVLITAAVIIIVVAVVGIVMAVKNRNVRS